MTVSDLARPVQPTPPAPPRRRQARWWQHFWVLPAMAAALTFVWTALVRYLSLDESRAQVRLDPDYPPHFALTVCHVIFGSVALTTVWLQIWPWFRNRWPRAHTWVGRTYVFGGALPAALFGLTIMPFSAGASGNAVGALLWLSFTSAGWWFGRTGQWKRHRRFMIYSFAMCASAVWGRIMLHTLPYFPRYDFMDPHTATQVLDTASWIGFVANLLLAQWWLERVPFRPPTTSRRRAVRPTASAPTA